MTSLYYAPLNKRLRSYYNEVVDKQIDINNNYVLNQQLLFDERMQRNSYAIFENQKKLTETLKTESKNLNAEEFQKKLHSQNPEIFYLPPSEKLIDLLTLPPSENSKTLAIEQPTIFLPPNIREALEAEQKLLPRGATPETTPKTTPRTKKGELTPITKLAEDAALRIKLRGNELYEKFRALPRAKKGGLPEIPTMKTFAEMENIDVTNKNTAKEIADTIIKGIATKENISAEGFKKYMKKNKYNKYKR